MGAIAQIWADLIHVSGGKVSLPKFCWWLVWWNWHTGKARLATVDEVAAQIKLTNEASQETKVLQTKNPSELVRQLGLLNDLEGTHQDDWDKCYSILKKMSHWMNKHYIIHKNTWRIYQNIWFSAGQYPIAVTSWTKKQCE
eukprot:15363606-Ditylum_brightwellii.AAC.1